MVVIKWKNMLEPQATLVSNQFIDNFMIHANGEWVKVYIFLLRYPFLLEREDGIKIIADALCNTESDVCRALEYWKKQGILEFEESKTPIAEYMVTSEQSIAMAEMTGYQTGGMYSGNIYRNGIISKGMVQTGGIGPVAPVGGGLPINGAAQVGGGLPISGTTPSGGGLLISGTVSSGSVNPIGGMVPAGNVIPIGGSTQLKGVSPAGSSAQVDEIGFGSIGAGYRNGSVTGMEPPPEEMDLDDTITRSETEDSCQTERIAKLELDEEFAQLIYVVQQYRKKPLTPMECETFAYLYDELQIAAELLEYVAEYCVQEGHTSIRYMEKVALDWHQKGVKTILDAKTYSEGFSKNSFAVMKALGQTRAAAPAEKKLIEKWFKEYGFTKEIVVEACNRTIMTIHAPSFDYVDKILQAWYKEEVHTLNDVTELDKKRKGNREVKKPEVNPKNRFHNFDQHDYDYEDMMWKMIQN